MQVYRSSNQQVLFPPASAQRRLTAIQYDGLPLSSAVVLWSVGLVELAGAVIVVGGLLLRQASGPKAEAAASISVIPRLVGSRGDVGGVVVLDLLPGDVLELVGFIDDAASFALVAGGLTVVIL